VRLLTLKIQEPIAGLVLPEMVADHGPEEAARRYRAIVVTTLRQLRGLSDARLRFLVEPQEAHEAVRFWLLPRLAEKWQARDGIFQADGWEIDFGGTTHDFQVHAQGEILCPHLGARWVHTALLGIGLTTSHVIGPACEGGEYFKAYPAVTSTDLPPRILPELPIIRTNKHWLQVTDSILGPTLKKAWEEEAN
jgi:hypothetical protein